MNLQSYFRKAKKERWAIGKFNFSNFEIFQAILEAAQKTNSPVIVETSKGESKSIGMGKAAVLVKSCQKEKNHPIFLHLDHGDSFDYIKKAIKAGYHSVHFDGSKLSLKENIKITKKVVDYAHKRKILVEGEVGFIKGASKILKKMPEIKKKDLTDPNDARKFIKETKVDSLAINIGSFHGMRAKGKNPRLNLKRLREVKEKTGKTPLILHGGSGISRKDIKAAIRLGITGININTELRVAYTNTLKKVLKAKPKETTPYKYMPEVIMAVQKVVEEKIKLFNSNNKA